MRSIQKIALPVAALVCLFLGASSQGQRSKDSLPARLFAQAKADDFIGESACSDCHAEAVAQFQSSGHAAFVHDPKAPIDQQGCESCHGPGAFHIRDEDSIVIAFNKIQPRDVEAACLRCHGNTMSESHWHRTAHAQSKEVTCTSCHQIHPEKPKLPGEEDTPAAKTVVASSGKDLVKKQVFPLAKGPTALLKADQATLCGQCHATEVSKFRLNSHHPIPEGRMECSDCHDIHPTKASPKRVTFVKEKCVACHADKAGPFTFEHDPVAGWSPEGCDECHNPHGSHNPKMLKAFSRGLCAQCHTDKLANHFPGRTCWSSGCHVALHGSNTSPQFLSR